jgi:WD40 repeat protein
MLQAREVLFQTVGEELHHGPVAGLSMCAWKPLFMTCGQLDKTVRVWNYESMMQELVKQYQQQLFSVAIHPTGTAPSKTHSKHDPALTVLSSCLPLRRTLRCDWLL